MSACARSALLKQHKPLVTRLAKRLASRLPTNVDIDDITQAGMLGLDQALSGFDEAKGASFDTYASRRIQGAMLDELRSADHLSRGVRSRVRKIQETVQRLEQELGRSARAIEVSRALGWKLQEVHDVLVEAGAPSKRLGDGDLDEAENEASLAEYDNSDFLADELQDPAVSIERRQRSEAVNDAFFALCERERLVLSMLYREDMLPSEIAVKLGISPSRVSQLHKSAVKGLRRAVQRRLPEEVASVRPLAVPELAKQFAARADIRDAMPAPDVAKPAEVQDEMLDWVDMAAARYLRNAA